MRRALSILLFLVTCVACGSTQRPRGATEADLRSITELEAQEIARELMGEQGVAIQTGWRVNVGATEPFDVDVRLAQSQFGIEFVSAQDRHELGDRIPRPDPSGQLRIMPGAGDDAQVQILILDHTSYRYDPDRERVQRGSLGSAEAQDRLRRDMRDYLEYVRGQVTL
jgi:hypothetical protein